VKQTDQHSSFKLPGRVLRGRISLRAAKFGRLCKVESSIWSTTQKVTGWWFSFNPSEKYEFVSWDDDIPKIWENKTCSKPPTR
jgi:hypothetical protein